MEIQYKAGMIPPATQVAGLYKKSGLPRPTEDIPRIQAMLDNSNLIATAWDDDKLVGVCRCITDWVWCCYLSDLAVDPDHKKSGIGKKLIELVRQRLGEQSMILLLSVPTAMDYYPKVGFTKEDRGFIIKRTK